jgi:hypothetical protein
MADVAQAVAEGLVWATVGDATDGGGWRVDIERKDAILEEHLGLVTLGRCADTVGLITGYIHPVWADGRAPDGWQAGAARAGIAGDDLLATL